jgi:uncharacterized membrane protein YbaN (DUF454 family)
MIRMNYQTKSQKDNIIISKLNNFNFFFKLLVCFFYYSNRFLHLHTRKPTFQTSVYDYKVLSASEKAVRGRKAYQIC